MPNKPFLSIITICFNEQQRIANTCESIINQLFSDFEWLVIDGGSTDGTLEILKKYSDRISILISEPDKGIYNAHNKGLQKASGHYCLFLNGGDELASPEILQQVFSDFHQEDILYGSLLVEEEDGESHIAEAQVKLTPFYFMHNTLWHPATFIKTSVLKEFNGYDEHFKLVADYDFFLRAYYSKKVSFKHLPYVISRFNMEGVGSKPESQQQVLKERLASQKQVLSPWFLMLYYTLFDHKNSKVPSLVGRIIKKIPLVRPLVKTFLRS